MNFSDHGALIESYVTRFKEETQAGHLADVNYDIGRIVNYLRLILGSGDEYEETTPYFHQYHFNDLIRYLNSGINNDSIGHLHGLLGLIASERYFSTNRLELESESYFFNYYSIGNSKLTPLDAPYLDEIVRRILPLTIKLANKSNLLTAEKFHEEAASKAEATRSRFTEIDEAITASEQRMEGYREYVEKLETDYNFVGLTKAFAQMERGKSEEAGRLWQALILSGILALLPPIVTLYLFFDSDGLIFGLTVPKGQERLYYAPVMASIFGVLVYYFRIVLLRYQSVHGQLLQLRLRKSICAFIEGYVDFAKEHKGVDMDKFSTLIFSNLVVDPGDIPSTFDGVDQVARIFSEVRK